MKKYATYSHLSKCTIGHWQGLIRGRDFDTSMENAIYSMVSVLGNYTRPQTRHVVYAVHLVDFLFHHINFPENKSRRVRAIKNKIKLPRSRYIPAEWFSRREREIRDTLDLLKHPLREEGEGEIQVGPFTLKNPINLNSDKVSEMEEACKEALKLCTNSLAPGFTQALYGDVILAEKLGRPNWYAWYSTGKDNITLKYFERDKEEFMKTFIHEIGHRYWRKNLSITASAYWEKYHNNCLRSNRINFNDWIDVDIGLFATKRRNGGWAITSKNKSGAKPIIIFEVKYGSPYLMVKDSKDYIGEVDSKWMKDYLSSLTGLFPTHYATTDYEEHFCEALSYKAFGHLHPKALEAFNSIIIDNKQYTVDVANFTKKFEIENPETQVEDVLPSKVEQVRTCESLASRLGLKFKDGRNYGVFIYTNDAVGSTHAYMFIDYATGNLFVPKTKNQPNLNVNIANITESDLDQKTGFERMNDLRPRWRTMNTITEPTKTAPETEVIDQTPEPSIPTTPEGNLASISDGVNALASALNMTAKKGRKYFVIIYHNAQQGTNHTYLLIDVQNGNIYPPKHTSTPIINAMFGNIFEPNIVNKVNEVVMDNFKPNWRTRYQRGK
jgi:hypothetical protein